MNVKIINFEIMGDERGSLIALEQNKNIPFEIKRVYYIFNTKEDVKRGLHAHKDLQQVLIALSGSCKILLDDGREFVEFELNSPDKGLFIDKLIWREIYNFSEDCVLLVLANEYYKEEDYIRNYQEFKNYIYRVKKSI
ncbi:MULTISPECIES: sugar 3,4-ketoisomerase [Anoxybacillaceae]|uniref:sugar 3,4-ketoisomerase n=1 Tax=Anoxybacillaceae TaxID=3120669 RepID=UPI0009BB68F0|nr:MULTISPECIES: FdtA/QdtA family cupin domain-containing protein [Anoxybacillus]OQM46896.1 dTDP-6-deoxy-3,4-keto-hexulose isomerase [Anoxybacillus sp. UARK-01]